MVRIFRLTLVLLLLPVSFEPVTAFLGRLI